MLVACIAVGFVLKYNELGSFIGAVGGDNSTNLSNTKLLLAICFFTILGGLYFLGLIKTK